MKLFPPIGSEGFYQLARIRVKVLAMRASVGGERLFVSTPRGKMPPGGVRDRH
jgi:hypothetical protein